MQIYLSPIIWDPKTVQRSTTRACTSWLQSILSGYFDMYSLVRLWVGAGIKVFWRVMLVGRSLMCLGHLKQLQFQHWCGLARNLNPIINLPNQTNSQIGILSSYSWGATCVNSCLKYAYLFYSVVYCFFMLSTWLEGSSVIPFLFGQTCALIINLS